jgi:hypothetical protein
MSREFTVEGRQMFAEELERFASGSDTPGLAKISARVSAPVVVSVHGRRGVGVTTVADALAAEGLTVREQGELAVLVTAEVLKPEDMTVIAGLRGRGVGVLIVLNKADLAGSARGGPVATAHRRAQQFQALTGLPVVPMVGLLARATVTPDLVAALQVLAVRPADLTSADAFLSAEHPVVRTTRAELLETLDRFGIAHASLEVSRGAADLAATLRRLSEIDRVLAALDALAAPVRYRRIERALTELQALGGERVGRFLAADATVLAVMAAAIDVVRADGLVVEPPATGSDAHVSVARYWRGYSRGPVNALHRSCGAAIARGALRLADSESAVRR